MSALAALCAGTMPAAALNASLPQSCGQLGDMVCTGAAQAVQNGSGSQLETMVYSCEAVSTRFDVATTGQTGVACYFIGGNDGVKYLAFQVDRSTNQTQVFLPGPAATLTGELTMKVQPYQLCVEGGYFVNGTLTPVGGPACSQLNA